VKDTFGYSSPQKVTSERDIRVEFTGKNLTKFGGIQLVRKFLRHLKVKEELENPDYIGTALTLQTCIGFLLTMISIRLIPVFVDLVSWH